MIIVPTIRHSGSHFVVNLLGYDIKQTFNWKQAGKARPDSLIFDHISPHRIGIITGLVSKHLTIIPLRHPFLIEKSWDDRNKDKEDLYQSFKTLINDIDPYEPFYLPLDTRDRETCLNAIRAATGLTLATDWMPQGVKHNNYDLRHKDVQPSLKMQEFYTEYRTFFDRFYRVAI